MARAVAESPPAPRPTDHATRLRPHASPPSACLAALSVATGVWVGVGARDEPAELARRVSHFLEHLLFKGTDDALGAGDLAASVDRVGGDINAFTAKEYTAYYCRLPARHAAARRRAARRRADRAGAARRRRRERAPGHPRGAGDGRRLARRRRPPRCSPSRCSPTTPSAGRRRATRRDGRRPSPPTTSASSSAAGTAPARWSSRSPARSTTTTSWPRWSSAFAARRAGARRRPARRRTPTPHPVVVDRRRHRAGPHRHGRPGPGPAATPTARRSTSSNHVLGGGLSSRLFEEIREQRGLAYSVYSGDVGVRRRRRAHDVRRHRAGPRRRGARA